MKYFKLALALPLIATFGSPHAETGAVKPTVRVESVKSGAEVAAELSRHEKPKAEAKPATAKPQKSKKTASGEKPDQPKRVKTNSR